MINPKNDKKNSASKKKDYDKGFTLVELIVVLVILAILAAILVPMLLGYIDSAKEKQDLLNAKNCLTAAQAELTNLYATESDNVYYGSVIPNAKALNSNQDVLALKRNNQKLINSDFAEKVFTTADDHPYCFIIGMERVDKGDYTVNKDVPASKPSKVTHGNYTVMYALYMKTADSAPLYFDGTSWSKNNPKNVGTYVDDNVTTFNGRQVKIQYYVLADAGGKDPHTGTFAKLNENMDYLNSSDKRKWFVQKYGKPNNIKNIWMWLRFYVCADDY
ncbi:MAG: type II secretion system protein [Lachnospiraceae bacterium]|nr:type II secretion system protein [Lachnospiraceae bacterium]